MSMDTNILENFLDVLKLLPNDMTRTFNLVKVLDQKTEDLKKLVDITETTILREAKEGEPPEDMMRAVRHHHQHLYNMSLEKVAVVEQADKFVSTYLARLDEEIRRLESDLGPDQAQAARDDHAESMDKARQASRKAARPPPLATPSTSVAQFDFFREAKEGGAGPAASPQPFGGGAGAGAGGATVHHVSGGPGTGDAMTTSGPPRKKDGTSSENALFCTCQQPSYGDMVACDGEDCPYEWFHYSCVGLKKQPKGKWYCASCLQQQFSQGI